MDYLILGNRIRNVMQNVSHIVEHVRKYRGGFYLVIFIGFLNNIVSFLLPVSIGVFFSLFFRTGSSKDSLLQWMGIELNSINQFFLFFSALLVIKGILTFIENYGSFKQGELFVRNMRESVFASQIHWSSESFPEKTYGKYLLRYSNDLKSIQNYLTRGYLDGIKSILFLITGFFLLMKINSELTLLLVFLLLMGVFIIFMLARWQTNYIVTSRSARSSLLAYVARQFARFKRLKAMEDEQRVLADFNTRSRHLFDENMKYYVTESIMLMLVPFLIFGIIGILLLRIYFLPGVLSASDGLMMVLILLMMEGGIRRLLKVPSYLNKGKISLQKIEKLRNEPRGEVINADLMNTTPPS